MPGELRHLTIGDSHYIIGEIDGVEGFVVERVARKASNAKAEEIIIIIAMKL